MTNDDVARGPRFQQWPQIFNMDVLTNLGAIAMFIFKECAFSDHHLCLAELVAKQEVADFSITGVGNSWNLNRLGDFNTLTTQFTQALLRNTVELIAQLATAFNHYKRQRRGGVTDFNSANKHIRP